MPELPEVETVRQSLMPHLPGRKVTHVRLRRPDVVRHLPAHTRPLSGQTIAAVDRRGKHLQIYTEHGPCLDIHLGMTGSMRIVTAGQTLPLSIHTHVLFTLDDGNELGFADPRRFGGMWYFGDPASLEGARLAKLGPDALTIQPRILHARLLRTRRALKAALLDQTVIAGLGNIYVDEALFAAQLNPATPSCIVSLLDCQTLIRKMRPILQNAIAARGSSLRDYVSSDGSRGSFQERHRVYGRTGGDCLRCKTPLATDIIAGRTTVWCPACQPVMT